MLTNSRGLYPNIYMSLVVNSDRKILYNISSVIEKLFKKSFRVRSCFVYCIDQNTVFGKQRSMNIMMIFFFSRTIGRVTMSRPAEWTTWSSSRRYRRVPLSTISKRGLWRTPYLYPFVIQETTQEYDRRLKEAIKRVLEMLASNFLMDLK